MPQVVNRSGHVIELYGTDTATATDRRWMLQPGRQTLANFDCTQLRAGDELGLDVFDSKDWWTVRSDYVFIYPPRGGDGFFTADLTLHCVPFVPASGPDPPWRRLYEPSPADPTRDGTPVGDPMQRDPEFPIDAQQIGVAEGELGAVLSGALGFYEFGLQTRTRMGGRVYITVRLTADPSIDLSDADLRRLDLEHPDAASSQLMVWKRRIEAEWAKAPHATTGETLLFECDWVTSNGHYNVDIVPAGGTGFRNLINKESTMEWWHIDIDDGERTPNFWAVSAHEFGHHLGLDDGYVYKYELPDLEAHPDVIAYLSRDADAVRLAGDKTMRRRSESLDWKAKILRIPPFSLFARLDRAAERIKNRQNPGTPDHMDDDHALSGSTPAPNITGELVDAILGRRLQKLYYRADHFFTKK